MYFAETDPKSHEEAYKKLLDLFEAEGEPEYESACYALAYPTVYAALPEGNPGKTPFTWYWGPYDQVLDRRGESDAVASLPEPERYIVRAAVELFAGRCLHFDLAKAVSIWNEELLHVFETMLRLRMGK